jgi:hypothetical protein
MFDNTNEKGTVKFLPPDAPHPERPHLSPQETIHADRERPKKLTWADVKVIQQLGQTFRNWDHDQLAAAQVQINGVGVNTGLVPVEIDGRAYQMDTDVHNLGNLLPEPAEHKG